MRQPSAIPVLFVFYSLLLTACHSGEVKEKEDLSSDRREARVHEPVLSDSEEHAQRRREEIRDSIITGREMDMVMQYANAHPDAADYDRWIDTADTHSPECTARYRFGHIFSPDRKHLLVLRYNGSSFNTDVYVDLFLQEKGKFRKMIRDTLLYGGYSDTLRDLNGDGYKDLVLSTYSSAGCCPREDETGYIYLPRSGDFNVDGFFNPDYFPEEKLVYEMDYGHPGEVTYSKYHWLGTRRELVETIAPTMEGNNVFRIRKPYTFTRTIYPSQTKYIIREVPPDFKRLGNYEYFISYQE